MKLRTLAVAIILSLNLGACVVSPPPRARSIVEVTVRPPAPRVVVVPAPRRGYVWAPGYWRWNGRAHIWVKGVWLRERRNEHWVPAHWEEGRPGIWHFEQGHWER